ncbi:MAG: endonuclease IV [Ruminococcaceae bacterium]|nr:endonuclease IV [Oscillospiraceae bacterium]
MTDKYALFGPGGNAEEFYAAGYKSTWQAPAWLKAKGLDAYEYQAGNGVVGKRETFCKIGEEAKKNGIALSFHAPYFISLSGEDMEKRLKSLSYIEQSLDAAEAMGADLIVIHTGSAGKISREKAMDLASDTIYKAVEAFGDRGISLGLETMGKQNQLGTPEEVVRLCKIDPILRPVVDFGHLYARSIGEQFTQKDHFRALFDLIGEGLGDEAARTLHCHFSMIQFTGAGEKKHLTFEQTEYGPRFEPLMEVIAEEGLTPRIICESAGTMAADALAMKTYYQSRLSAH